jgi:histidine ammonia-lyase
MYEISPAPLSLDNIDGLLRGGEHIGLSAQARERIQHCRKWLEAQLEKETPIYGVTTGFGSQQNQFVDAEDRKQLQINLLISHAVGSGPQIPEKLVKLMLFLKAQSLAYGHSGIRELSVQRLCELYNLELLPIVPEQGSLGASGDLCPLSHMSLPLIGMGQVSYKGETREAAEVLAELNMAPLQLEAKEGLALINGTQFMSAYAVWAQLEAQRLLDCADFIAAVGIEAALGRMSPYSDLTHRIRPHQGQIQSAKNILAWIDGSPLLDKRGDRVQDQYSFRCTPQVHGASRDALRHTHAVIETEINSVTDNPLLFPDEEQVISGGNFHGQALALSLDFMAIAVAELGSIAERRTYRLLGSAERNLPEYLLAGKAGLNSGLMMPQYSAAALVSQNKQLCTPASVDSIPSSNGQEDHVSMGANAATKLARVIENTWNVMGIAAMVAFQALDLRCKEHACSSSPQIEKIRQAYREQVEFLEDDRLLYPDMKKSTEFIRSDWFDSKLKELN